MLVYGTRAKTINGPLIEGRQCTECGKREHRSFGLIRYAHVYWIPLFVTKKLIGIECTHCKRTLIDKEVPSEIAEPLRPQLFTKARVLPRYAGVLVLLLLLGGFLLLGKQSSEEQAKWLAAPATNDLYIVRLDRLWPELEPEYPYGLMKVVAVTDEEMSFKVGTVVYSKASGVRKDIRTHKISESDYYADELFYADPAELPELKADGSIVSVRRP